MTKTKIHKWKFLLLILPFIIYTCSSESPNEKVILNKTEELVLESIVPQLLDKSVKEIKSELSLKKEKILLIQEPSLIIRGFFYQWNEKITFEFMTDRLSSVNLKKDKIKEEIRNSEEIDYSNLLNEKVIGIKWETIDSIFYIGKGFLWNHHLFVGSSKEVKKLQRIKKEK